MYLWLWQLKKIYPEFHRTNSKPHPQSCYQQKSREPVHPRSQWRDNQRKDTIS